MFYYILISKYGLNIDTVSQSVRGMKSSIKRQSNEKHGTIASQLRRQIINAHYRPGEILPTRAVLCQRFGTTAVTLQKAFARLKEDGFIVTNGRHGSRVAERPPHLSRFGLVFRGVPTKNLQPDFNQNWTFFQAAFAQVATQLRSQTADLELVPFYGVDERLESGDAHRLMEEVRHERLAGVIFIDPPWWLGSVPAFQNSTVPCISFATAPFYPPCPFIRRDGAPWMRRAVAYLKQRRRVRPTVILGVRGAGYDGDPNNQRLMECVKSEWPALPDHLIYPVHVGAPEMACKLVQTLMTLPSAIRPDAVLVNDDHLIEQVALGLSYAPVVVGQELDVVSHANFPLLPPVAVPVKFLGYDVVTILQTCIELLAAQREGRQLEMVTPWEPIFDHEIMVAPAQVPLRVLHSNIPQESMS